MTYVMPWGKHKGKPLDEIPLSYLGFVFEECDNISLGLEEEVRYEIATRIKASLEDEQPEQIDKKRLKDWYKKASILCHPDHGGTNEIMKLMNEMASNFLK
jgi:2-phosphoglycerate kinase